MSKRNFILLIIILVIVAIVGLWLFSAFGPATPGNDGEVGTNFLSRFNPFGRPLTPTPPSTAPSNEEPTTEPTTEPGLVKLKKVSSVPVAGYAVFQKERLKSV